MMMMEKVGMRLLKLNVFRHGRGLATTCKRLDSVNTDSSQINAGKSLHNQKVKLKSGPSLEHFIANSKTRSADPNTVGASGCDAEKVPYLTEYDIRGDGKKVYFYVYGCQMNVNDTEIAWSILQNKGYQRTSDVTEADVVLVMTCSIRDGAEQKIWKKLKHLKMLKSRRPFKKKGPEMKIGILGCMAERLKTKIVEQEKMVDVVCGPDAYKDLPRLLASTENKQAAVNVLLSLDETYANVMPVRLNSDAVSAYVSIMRGCDNMCSYCIVPYTRGRERSRPIDSIVDEVKMLSDQGVKEVTLLGQNVNSYRDMSESEYFGNSGLSSKTQLSPGFKTVYKPKSGGRRFSELLDKVSLVDPEMRVRFTSPHPKDFPDEVLHLMNERVNICNQIHLPAQSGNNKVLADMRRGYTIEAYLELVEKIRSILPDVALTSDFIAGFCGETEEAHQDTVDLLRRVKYNVVYCYPYSMRQKTGAYHRLKDDVPEDVKSRRHEELARVFREEAEVLNQSQIGSQHIVLVEGLSKRSPDSLAGRNDNGIKVIIPNRELEFDDGLRLPKSGDYIVTQIVDSSSQVLHGVSLHGTTLQNFYRKSHRDRTRAYSS